MKFSKIASELQALPPELVDPIINPLPVQSVLAIAASGNDYLRQCIQRSQSWRHLFPDELRAQRLIHLYLLWTRLMSLTADGAKCGERESHHGHITYPPETTVHYGNEQTSFWLLYSEDATQFCISKPDYLSRLTSMIVALFKWAFFGSEYDNATLKAVSQQRYLSLAFPGGVSAAYKHLRPDTDLLIVLDGLDHCSGADNKFDYDAFDEKMDMYCRLDTALHQCLRSELLQLAGLLEQNPKWLKKLMDYRQTMPKKYPQPDYHIINRFRQDAKCVGRNKIFQGKRPDYKHTSHWQTNYLPLIPRNASLQLFLGALQKHSFTVTEDIELHTPTTMIREVQPRSRLLKAGSNLRDFAAGRLRGIAWDSEMDVIDLEEDEYSIQEYPYPATVRQQILTVVRGMDFLYSIESSFYSQSSRITAACPVPHAIILPTCFDSPSRDEYWQWPLNDVREAHDERELEWLTAYLACVRYMEKAFPDIVKDAEALDQEIDFRYPLQDILRNVGDGGYSGLHYSRELS